MSSDKKHAADLFSHLKSSGKMFNELKNCRIKTINKLIN